MKKQTNKQLRRNYFHCTVYLYQVSFEIVRHSGASWRKKSECTGIFKVNFINIRVGKCATRKPKLGFLWNFWCHSYFPLDSTICAIYSAFSILKDISKQSGVKFWKRIFYWNPTNWCQIDPSFETYSFFQKLQMHITMIFF